MTFVPSSDSATIEPREYSFVQTQAAVQAGIAVHRYGAVIFPANNATAINLEFTMGGVTYVSNSQYDGDESLGSTVAFTRKDYIPDTLSALSITNVTLTPSFASGTLTYTGATSSASGTLTATAADDATKVVKMNGTAVTGTSLSFASGAGNVLTIDVTGVIEGQPSTKQYKVTITRS